MTNTETPLFKIGRVTGRIAPGTLGEVMVSIRGGSEGFLAESDDPAMIYERGARVRVLQYYPPRSVIVGNASDITEGES